MSTRNSWGLCGKRGYKVLLNTFMTGAVIIWKPVHYLQSKSMDWFLYDNGLRHESVNDKKHGLPVNIFEFSALLQEGLT